MKTSESIAKIVEALAKAEKSIKHAMKDAKNPHLKSSYATLESLIDASKDELLANGIIVIQSPSGDLLTTRLQHTSGEFIESELRLYLTKQDMQGLGSAITYARRYSLAAMLNISQTDDDGHHASQSHQQSQPVQVGAPQLPQSGPTDSSLIVVKALTSIQEKDLARKAGFKWSGKAWIKSVTASELDRNSYPFQIEVVR